MKKFLTIGALALALAAINSQPAPAWLNWKFGLGLNFGWQSGGNNTLWGFFRNGQPPAPDCGGGIGGGCGGPCGPGGAGYLGAPPIGPMGGPFGPSGMNAPAEAAAPTRSIPSSYTRQAPYYGNTVGYRYSYSPYNYYQGYQSYPGYNGYYRYGQ